MAVLNKASRDHAIGRITDEYRRRIEKLTEKQRSEHAKLSDGAVATISREGSNREWELFLEVIAEAGYTAYPDGYRHKVFDEKAREKKLIAKGSLDARIVEVEPQVEALRKERDSLIDRVYLSDAPEVLKLLDSILSPQEGN